MADDKKQQEAAAQAERERQAAEQRAAAEREAAEKAAQEQRDAEAARLAAEQAERDRLAAEQGGDGSETAAADASARLASPVHGETDNAVSVANARRTARSGGGTDGERKGPLDDPDFGGQVAGSGGFGQPVVYSGQDTTGPGVPTAVVADNPGLGRTASEPVEGRQVEALAHAGEPDVRRVTASQAADMVDAARDDD